MRKFNVYIGLLAAVAAFGVPAVHADEHDGELDGVEMDVMDATTTPNEASTKVLVLPEGSSDKARERAQRGLDTANAAREGGAEFGAATAEAAREAHGAPEGTPTGRPDTPPRP